MRMSQDQQLREQVIERRGFAQTVNPAWVDVTVIRNVVTLTGAVDTDKQKLMAVQTAQHVSGVHGMADELEDDLGVCHQRTDREVALEALTWSWIAALQAVRVKVERGWVNLQGELAWDFQWRAAHDAVANLIGVKGVSNLISLRPNTNPGELEGSIERAFERRSKLDAKQVMVAVSVDQVTLSGQTSSWAGHEQAANATWSVVGVTGVENHIKVAEPVWSER
jgi:osmotically-inducible protein OsmY